MDDIAQEDGGGRRPGGRRPRGSRADELVLRTIAKHAESLLRTARRHSLCADDAQDAYQRGLEIFLRNAHRLNAGTAPPWLHTVVKHESKAIRRERARLVGTEEADLDSHAAHGVPTPDERLLSFDLVTRSAEALQRLKPQELRALWLKAQGLSYGDIAAETGWSYTKVNRCISEGRKAFLERYAGIESGAECERWAPTLSAVVDGEATSEQLVDLRPHLRNCTACRATLKALQDSARPLEAVLPVPLVLAAGAADGGETASSILLRAYEAVAGGLHDRATTAAFKVQAVVEGASASKVAAVAASTAALAGGGVATVEQVAAPDQPSAAEVRADDRREREEARQREEERQRAVAESAQAAAVVVAAPVPRSEPAPQPAPEPQPAASPAPQPAAPPPPPPPPSQEFEFSGGAQSAPSAPPPAPAPAPVSPTSSRPPAGAEFGP